MHEKRWTLRVDYGRSGLVRRDSEQLYLVACHCGYSIACPMEIITTGLHDVSKFRVGCYIIWTDFCLNFELQDSQSTKCTL